MIDEAAARRVRRSDRVFLFGSSASLNDITVDEWRRIEEHDTFGFNWFVRQDFVRCDFHLIRQIADSNEPSVRDPQVAEYCAAIASSPRFAHTVLLVQHEWRAIGTNVAVARGQLPKRRLMLWHTNDAAGFSPSFRDGLVHGTSTVFDSINAAVLLGWREIVLVGIDLYDRRYFWAPDETRAVDAVRGATAADPHSQSSTGFVDRVAEWHTMLGERGVRLSVYNPRSLLAERIPVFEWHA